MLPLSAIIMLIFGTMVLYGGLLYFLYRALRRNNEDRDNKSNKRFTSKKKQ